MQRLGEMLTLEGLVQPQAVDEALGLQRESGRRLGSQLVLMGYLSEKAMLGVLGRQLEVEVYDPAALQARLGEAFLNAEALKSLPLGPAFLKKNRCVPVAVTPQAVWMAVRDPLDHLMIESVAYAAGNEVTPVLATADQIEEIIEQIYGGGASGMGRILESMGSEAALGPTEETVERLKDLASEAPVVRLVQLLIANAVEARASDIHFEPFEDEFTVRYRVDGVLERVESPPKRLQSAVLSRLKLMAGLNIAERRLPQDGRIQMRLHGREIDFRVSTVPTAHGESLVMRILDRASISFDLAKVGFPEDVYKRFQELILRPHGIILVTGPTGSGKTTTLYAALEKINTVERKIITVEDPVEYLLKGVNQIHVNAKIGLTFASGLRSIVRQDPDVILVGEIRDHETAEIAIQSSLTGHLVFSTLHTNDAPTAIGRLNEMGVEEYLIASSVIGVLAQRLVRLLCPACKTPVPPPPEAKGMKAQFFEGAGCPQCRNTGYKGRKPIFEIMKVNDPIRTAVLEKADAGKIMKIAREGGLRTLREDGIRLAALGLTSMSEVARVTGFGELE